MVLAPREAHWHSARSALSAEVSVGKDCRGPQQPRVWESTVALRAVGVFSGKGCWRPPEFPQGMSWAKGSLLVLDVALECPHGSK